MRVRAVIVGSGHHIPEEVIATSAFAAAECHTAAGTHYEQSPSEITARFEALTGIRERRWAPQHVSLVDGLAEAARQALASGIPDKDWADIRFHGIYVAHNFGEVHEGGYSEMVPSLASRLKQALNITDRSSAVDVVAGCPGWVHALYLAVQDLEQTGEPDRYALVVGGDFLSRVTDEHDRDRMLFGDGAGAVLLRTIPEDASEGGGFLGWTILNDGSQTASYLHMGRSYHPEKHNHPRLYLKMHGRKVYEYAVREVPAAISALLRKVGYPLQDIRYLLMHQANAKMNQAILRNLLREWHLPEPPYADFAPSTVETLGNTSVATIPTLYDRLRRSGRVRKGDVLVMVSVGAGMGIAGCVYREV